MCTEVEALAKNYYSFKQIFFKNCVVNCYENTDFRNLWLFGSGPFLIYFLDIMDQKMAQSKKVAIMKTQFFHARQPREGIFEIRSFWGLILTIVCLSFYLSVQRARDFNVKIIWPHKFILTRYT